MQYFKCVQTRVMYNDTLIFSEIKRYILICRELFDYKVLWYIRDLRISLYPLLVTMDEGSW